MSQMILPPLTQSVSLWPRAGSGHTREVVKLTEVHSGPETAATLVTIASQGGDATRAAESTITLALEGISRLQNREKNSPRFGCFRWYAEESQIHDTNAAFFVGLNLLALYLGYYENIPKAGRALLLESFAPLDAWFDREVSEGAVFYPNKFLGDLVCSWLLKEALGKKPSQQLLQTFLAATNYWRDHHWGWGEHLSDSYSKILLTELSCLLLLAQNLPKDLREGSNGLFRGLMAIEDMFEGGPRVPAIRNYDLTVAPCTESFRCRIQSHSTSRCALDPSSKLSNGSAFPFESLLASRGWQELAGPPLPRPSKPQVSCFGGHLATAAIEEDFRLGSMSQFPIMPQTNHKTWGLAWQSMPVAFCGTRENWGILRWMTEENSVPRYHPARNKKSAYLENALSDVTVPPIVGHTQCHQEGFRVVALRTMPVISRLWQRWGDGWDIVNFMGNVVSQRLQVNGWSRLHLRFGSGRELALLHRSLSHDFHPHLEEGEGELHWRVSLNAKELDTQSSLADLWVVGKIEDPDPELTLCSGLQYTPMSKKWKFHWPPMQRSYVLSGEGGDLKLSEA